MTPGARVQAAIEALDRILEGAPAEQVLTRWARASRYAGSKDRAAVRDHVFDALRRLSSAAARGGARTGRGVMLGLLREAGTDPDTLFTGAGHAPAPLSVAEREGGRMPAPGAEAADMPDWLWPMLVADLGPARAEAQAQALRQRAGVHLRVNLRKGGVAAARDALARDGIETAPHPGAATALEVTAGARRLRQSAAWLDGLVELQDAASQAVAAALPLADGMRVLDYCAGGGGKTLAMAGQAELALFAHDADPARMRDLPGRAARADVAVRLLDEAECHALAPFDLVLCDVPCSGSGAWRRAPDGKWRLDPARLAALVDVQAAILERAQTLVGPGGWLAYATCSLLTAENAAQIAAFQARHPGWRMQDTHSWWPDTGQDGFFLALLTRD